ncbi:MAG: hypothetical protein WKG07_20165 [Hymenobacter sp.]
MAGTDLQRNRQRADQRARRSHHRQRLARAAPARPGHGSGPSEAATPSGSAVAGGWPIPIKNPPPVIEGGFY